MNATVDFASLKLIPQIFKKMESVENELLNLKQHLNTKYDLTKRAGVKAFLNISDGTLNNMIKDGRFKQNVHYKKEIKGKKIKIIFVEDGILTYKKGLG